MMLLMLKQVLKLSQGQRDLAAAVFDTFIVKSSLVPVVSMQQQTKAYSQQVKKMGKKHQLGSPHVWAYCGMVAAPLGKHSEGIGAKNKEALSGHQEQLELLTATENTKYAKPAASARPASKT